MDSLSTLLSKMSIDEYERYIKDFVQSATSEQDCLKLAFFLCVMADETSQALSSINSDKFVQEMKDKISKAIGQVEALSHQYKSHLNQNECVAKEIADEKFEERMNGLSEDVRTHLREMDALLKKILLLREHLPIAENSKG